MNMTPSQKAAFGIGAIGKDMVYALSASYVMYYYQDLLGLSATFVGTILMIARVFDALNDPFMGVLVAKTRTRWGRFRPWLLSGTVLNAFVLYALFAAPSLEGTGLMVYFSVFYILWGITYTMMDIPYWSMIPAIASSLKDRENLSVIGRTCAGVGGAVIQMGTMMAVGFLGGSSEKTGFRYVALIVAALFILAELLCCLKVREKTVTNMKTAGVREMFRTLFANDQAIVVVITIVLINTALYITSNLIIYFFKYDFGGEAWKTGYSLFATVGGVFQILGMMVLYPFLRTRLSNEKIFVGSLCMSMAGYGILLGFCFTSMVKQLAFLCIPGALVFMANGMLSVLTTVFLAGSVDYGEVKNGHREESVIFSMQTFVVKAASGLAVFLTGIGLDLIGLAGNTEDGVGAVQSASTLTGLRLLMTVIPIVGLVAALVVFKRRFKLTDAYSKQLHDVLEQKK